MSNNWWNRPTSGTRIGRIGEWDGNGGGGSSSGASSSGGRRIATLGDLGGSGTPMGGMGAPGGGHGHGHDDDDDDEEPAPRDEGESWYAGGERSGISIQNPDRGNNVPGGDVVRDLLRRAAEGGPAPPAPGAPDVGSAGGPRWGAGNTLGSDEVESSFIPDPEAAAAEDEAEPAIRHITFWREGFSVEDGPLMRYDDPANSQVLNEINSGRAPPSILDVQAGQPVELRVARRLNESYVPSPTRAAAAFSGQGARLGSAVPDVSGPSQPVPGAFNAGSPAAPSAPRATVEPDSIQTRFQVDQSQPTTSVQIRLADGTRLVCRMNLTHKVGDIRNFINAASPENLTRPYTIGTTFPNKTLENDTETIEEAGLKNAVVVQRWV